VPCFGNDLKDFSSMLQISVTHFIIGQEHLHFIIFPL